MSDVDPQSHLSQDDHSGPAPRPAAGDAGAAPSPDDLLSAERDASGGDTVGDLPTEPEAMREEGRERAAWDEDTPGTQRSDH
ncbi:hypothetical protein [Agilicoccus flavus]|uniref:hypothetical protein n=1 Tax=Agilicoccus flavus TaxID=2775968 RepID=UPI001CF64CF8|nr:hypothetical protein [Agilicoccus flavus]